VENPRKPAWFWRCERSTPPVDHGATVTSTPLNAAADWSVAEHGFAGKLFTAEPLAIITELSPTGA
jgi:hypothetical protein